MKFIFLILALFLLYGTFIGVLLLPPVMEVTHGVSQLIQPIPPEVRSREEIRNALWSANAVVISGEDVRRPFNQAELSHLQDVHTLLKGFFFLFVLSVVVSLIFRRAFVKHMDELPWRRIFWFLVALSIFCVIGFPVFFEGFHRVFFPNGNYSFSVDSLLIQTFPVTFWILEFGLVQLGVLVMVFRQSRRAGK